MLSRIATILTRACVLWTLVSGAAHLQPEPSSPPAVPYIAPAHTKPRGEPRYLPSQIIAHRGAAKKGTKENSLKAIAGTAERGYGWVEVDIRATADGKLIAYHDAYLGRRIKGNGAVIDLTYAQLQQLAHEQNVDVPGIEQVLAAARGPGGLVLDIKSGGVAKELARTLKQYFALNPEREGKVLLMSFNHQELLNLMHLIPNVPRAPILQGVPLNLRTTLSTLHPAYVMLHKDFLDPTTIASAQQAGCKVFAFTVNKKNELLEVSKLGLDGIITDKPERALSLRQPLKESPESPIP